MSKSIDTRLEEIDDSFVYTIWEVVKHDSLASGGIGQPSLDTREKIKQTLTALVEDEVRKAEEEGFKNGFQKGRRAGRVSDGHGNHHYGVGV